MQIISDNIVAWLAATIIAFLTIFSDKILERIRFSLNRADLRVKYFEELAMDLSSYVFWVEVFHERYQRGWTNDPDDLAGVAGELNVAMTTLRKKEYDYRSWVRKYWGSDAAVQFVNLMNTVKAVDVATHAFNDPGKEDQKTTALGKELDALRSSVELWMSRTNA